MKQIICYIEESDKATNVLSPFIVCPLQSERKRGFPIPWSNQRDRNSLVYKEHCQLSWDDLELVTFIPGEPSSRGVFCWCDLNIQLDNPELLLDEVGEVIDGKPAVTRGLIEAWLRPKMVETLEWLASRGDLSAEAFWPTVADGIVERLGCPPGVVIDDSDGNGTAACVLRKVRSFDQYVEETIAKTELRRRLEQIRRDGDQMNHELPELDKIDEQNDLLTPAERELDKSDRLAAYRKILDQCPSRRQMLVQIARENVAESDAYVHLSKTDLRHKDVACRTGTAFRDIGTKRIATCPINTPLHFDLESRREGYVTVLNVATSGRIWLVTPNAYINVQKARLDPAFSVRIPGPELLPSEQLEANGLDFVEVGPPGWEHLLAFVSDEPLISTSVVDRSRAANPLVELSPNEVEQLWNNIEKRETTTWSGDALSFLVGG